MEVVEGMDLEEALAAHVGAVSATVSGAGQTIKEIAVLIASCFEGGGKLLLCGNGGSAADAQHFAAEFVNRFRINRRPWPAIALSTDTSIITSIANDAEFDDIFARQIYALGRPGDVLIAFSTSGASRNVLAALAAGRECGMAVVGFTGAAGNETMASASDLLLVVPSRDTARVQECHEFVYHVIAEDVERELLRIEATKAEH